MTSKLITMREAVERHVTDGCTLAIEGFTAFICFAYAAHEIIRQRKRDLVLCRLTPDLIYDQMIAAGVARKLIFSYLGNPGVGSLHAIRRAVELGVPRPLRDRGVLPLRHARPLHGRRGRFALLPPAQLHRQ